MKIKSYGQQWMNIEKSPLYIEERGRRNLMASAHIVPVKSHYI